MIFHSFLSTTILQLVARAAIAPKAASQGAKTTPTIPTVAGISSSTFPFSSFTIILVMFPSCKSSFTFSTRLSAEMVNSSLTVFMTGAPQAWQNFASSFSFVPHLEQ